MLLSLPVSSPIYHDSSLNKLLHGVRSVLNNTLLHAGNASLLRSSPSLRASSESAAETTATVPFALSYLINECGVRPESAATAVKYVHFETPDRADVVLGFFRSLGFSSSQISTIVGRNPRLLACDPEKSVLPRLRFLDSNGFSASDIAAILLRASKILNSSVEERMLPNLNFLRSVIPSEEKVIRAVMREPSLLTCKLESYLIPSIKILRESGVGDSSIMFLLVHHPMALMTPQNQLSEIVERVKQMGVAPELTKFGVAIQAIRGMSEGTWERKIDAYKKWGWSEEVTLKAFRKYPWCMTFSEQKINDSMDYYANQIGLDALDVADRPAVLGYSLNKRIMPRDAVLCVLLSKGLIKSRFFIQALQMSDEMFQKKFVEPYKEDAPELLQLFRERKHQSRLQDGKPVENGAKMFYFKVRRRRKQSV